MSAPDAPKPFTVLGELAEITGWTYPQIGQLLGMPRSTVEAYIAGRRREALSGDQEAKVLAVLQGFRDEITKRVARLELML